MIDFHSHILPGMDDGPETMEGSLAMLRESFRQGVDTVISTSHFYAFDECPEEFLLRRSAAARDLEEAMLLSAEVYPEVILGAEVLYFPGISQAEGIESLRIGDSRCILIEPPMAPWTGDMLDEIATLGENFDLLPVIAHVDRYMRLLKEESLIDRVLQRNLVVQVNGSYFLNPQTRKKAVQNLKAGKIHLVGSDCHNLDSRPPNLRTAWKQAKAGDAEAEFKQLRQNGAELLKKGREIR